MNRITTFLYDNHRVEGVETILFGTENGKPICYSMRTRDWSKEEKRLLAFAKLSGKGFF